MNIGTLRFITLLTIIAIAACSKIEQETSIEKSEWRTEAQVLKTIENINFNFPASGCAFDKKDDFIIECLEAIESNRIR
jgi:hypothetical protein